MPAAGPESTGARSPTQRNAVRPVNNVHRSRPPSEAADPHLRERIAKAATWDELLAIADDIAAPGGLHPDTDLEFAEVCKLIERLRALRAARDAAVTV